MMIKRLFDWWWYLCTSKRFGPVQTENNIQKVVVIPLVKYTCMPNGCLQPWARQLLGQYHFTGRPYIDGYIPNPGAVGDIWMKEGYPDFEHPMNLKSFPDSVFRRFYEYVAGKDGYVVWEIDVYNPANHDCIRLLNGKAELGDLPYTTVDAIYNEAIRRGWKVPKQWV